MTANIIVGNFFVLICTKFIDKKLLGALFFSLAIPMVEWCTKLRSDEWTLYWWLMTNAIQCCWLSTLDFLRLYWCLCFNGLHHHHLHSTMATKVKWSQLSWWWWWWWCRWNHGHDDKVGCWLHSVAVNTKGGANSQWTSGMTHTHNPANDITTDITTTMHPTADQDSDHDNNIDKKEFTMTVGPKPPPAVVTTAAAPPPAALPPVLLPWALRNDHMFGVKFHNANPWIAGTISCPTPWHSNPWMMQ